MFGTTSLIRPFVAGFVVFVGGALEWLGHRFLKAKWTF